MALINNYNYQQYYVEKYASYGFGSGVNSTFHF